MARACAAGEPDPTLMHVVLLGPPGAGKGTQAAVLAEREGRVHLSTGQVLRDAISAGSELGHAVQAVVEAGRLVDDAIVAELVAARLDGASNGVILDGFPRNVRQAARLDELLAERGMMAPLVVDISVPEDQLVRRLASRKSCAACGPRGFSETRCGRCGGELGARPDDAESVVRERLRVYHEETAPVSEYYRQQGRLLRVDGTGPAAVVADRLAEVLASARKEGQIVH